MKTLLNFKTVKTSVRSIAYLILILAIVLCLTAFTWALVLSFMQVLENALDLFW